MPTARTALLPRPIRAFVAALLVGASCAAQPSTGPGAPAWIKPGMRITFYTMSASTGAGEVLQPDEQAMENARKKAQEKADETGETQHYTYWKDKQGQQYSLRESPGLSGQAYVQVTVAALDRTTAVLDTRMCLIDVGTGVVRAPTPIGSVVAADTGGEYWMHPALLRELAGQTAKGVSVQRTTCELKGRTYQAIQIRVRNDAGYTQRIYDSASGVLLRLSSATTRGANAWVPDAGGQSSSWGGGGTILTEGWLVGTRQLKLPWIGMPAPNWVRQTRTLRYAGTQGALVPGTGPLGFPVSVRISMRRTGADWVEFTEAAETTGPYGTPPQQSETSRVAGTNQVGGLWIPPAALVNLKPGDQLDNDTVTHVRFTVEAADPSRVTLLETGAEHRTSYVYDRRNGLLVATSQQQQVGPATAQMSVKLIGRE